jgi:hypothetical protein
MADAREAEGWGDLDAHEPEDEARKLEWQRPTIRKLATGHAEATSSEINNDGILFS